MSNGLEHVEHLTNLSKAKGFLGREFLTWLWYLIETNDESLTVPGRGQDPLEFDLWIDDRIVLEATAGNSHQNVMKGGDPSQSHEASAALFTGKTVREMKIGVNAKGYGEMTAVLNCDDLNPRGLKLPKPDADGAAQAAPDELPIVARLKCTETFLAILDGLFQRFLSQRTADVWQADSIPAMREWIKKRQKDVESGILH
jgi:hypothetical protein